MEAVMRQVKTALYKKRYRILAVLFWLGIWQLTGIIVNNEILLATPSDVIKVFTVLAFKRAFWLSIMNSFFKIAAGFILAVVLGIVLAVMSERSLIIKEIITPFMKVVQATPVASFIVLVLLWVSSRNLSIVCSFLMVVPVIYTNVLQGLLDTDPKMLQMAYVFCIRPLRKIRYIYIPAVMPYFVSASTVGLGLCWKAGIAAEVIGLPKFSIGEQLYEAKINLMTDQLFAWTIVIILVSLVSEKLMIRLIRSIERVLT
jgi:NitT/TauT family transport system permease protein